MLYSYVPCYFLNLTRNKVNPVISVNMVYRDIYGRPLGKYPVSLVYVYMDIIPYHSITIDRIISIIMQLLYPYLKGGDI